MSEYSSPITYGLAHPAGFFTKYPPITGRISTNPYDWNYGGVNMYPRPFNSWYQQINSGNNYLGPFARKVSDGKSGRIKMSMGGEIGFVEQCWYDFPRGNFDTDSNGDKYPENREFWAQAEKVTVSVYNLMTTGPNYVDVQVTISNTRNDDGTSSDPYTWSDNAYGGGFFRYIKAAVDIFSGSVHGMPGDTSTCGVGDTSGYTPEIIPPTGGVSLAAGAGFGGVGIGFTHGGYPYEMLEELYDNLSPADKLEVDPSGNGILAMFADWWHEEWTNLSNFLAEVKDDREAFLNADDAIRFFRLDQWAGLLGAVGGARNAFIDGWYIPNIEQVSGLPNSGTASDPTVLRERDSVQQRWASYLLTDGDGSPNTGGQQNSSGNTVNYGDARDYIPHTTPNNASGNLDWDWYLILLNRGDTTSVPYVDADTNEFKFRENYGFGRGNSIESVDPFINQIEAEFGTQVADSIGVLFDMDPAARFFVGSIGPIVKLELTGRAIKKERGEAIGPTNLDAYRTTVIDIAISAENMKAGNPTLYNYLTTVGLPDANGNIIKMTPVVE